MDKNIRDQINKVITDLEKQGYKKNSHRDTNKIEGLGDAVEATLRKFGITEERFKKFFGLKECNCTFREQRRFV